jgi:hypothetical protein
MGKGHGEKPSYKDETSYEPYPYFVSAYRRQRIRLPPPPGGFPPPHKPKEPPHVSRAGRFVRVLAPPAAKAGAIVMPFVLIAVLVLAVIAIMLHH